MHRRGVTIIELMVALIGASVVLGAAAILLANMSEDQRRASYWREHYYSRARAGMEVLWTVRQIPRRGLRQDAAGGAVNPVQNPTIAGGVGVDLGDGLGARGVITYVRDLYGQSDPPALPDAGRSVTGIIFRYFNTIYRFECDFTGTAGLGIPALAAYPGASGFNAMSGAELRAFILAVDRLQGCDLLATGVDTFDVFYIRDVGAAVDLQYSLQWNLSLAR